MTEQEWTTSSDPAEMLRAIDHRNARVAHKDDPIWRFELSDRKLRLFACAVCRQVWDGTTCERCGGKGQPIAEGGEGFCWGCRGPGRVGGLTDPRSRRAVEVAERFADGQATAAESDAVPDVQNRGHHPQPPPRTLPRPRPARPRLLGE